MRRKDKKKNKRKLIIIIILIIIVIISCVFLVKYFYNRFKTEKTKEALDEIQIDTTKITDTNTERMLKLTELQKQNSEIVGWIEIEGTDINYPVAQTTNNDYYMKNNYKKEYNSDGTLFIDKDYKWEPPNTNILIYGHNNKDGSGMFHSLLEYKSEDFYKTHSKIKFTTKLEDAEYKIIAVFESRVYYKSEQDVFRYYYFINAENEREFNEYIDNCKKASLYETGETAEYGNQIMTLSTCAYHTEDGRFAVVAKKIK